MQETLDAVSAHGTEAAASRALGIKPGTFKSRHERARRWQAEGGGVKAKGFELTDLPDETPTAEELLKRRETQFARKAAAKDARKLIPVNVSVDGPIGIAHFGDPHVDDDGTDLRKLRTHVDLCNATDGLFAACVGDYSNNWARRRARRGCSSSG
jgi:hypothetical protein